MGRGMALGIAAQGPDTRGFAVPLDALQGQESSEARQTPCRNAGLPPRESEAHGISIRNRSPGLLGTSRSAHYVAMNEFPDPGRRRPAKPFRREAQPPTPASANPVISQNLNRMGTDRMRPFIMGAPEDARPPG